MAAEEEARRGRRLKQSRSLSAFICYYFIVSSAKDGPRRVSPVLNHVRSVNRSVLSANRTRETTLRLISTTSNRIRLLLFYYAVKAILNHLWDAAERFLPCFLPTSSGNAFQKLKGIRVTSCLPIFGNSVTDHLFSFFPFSPALSTNLLFFLETACCCRCGFLDISDSFQELGLRDIKIDLCNQILAYT